MSSEDSVKCVTPIENNKIDRPKGGVPKAKGKHLPATDKVILDAIKILIQNGLYVGSDDSPIIVEMDGDELVMWKNSIEKRSKPSDKRLKEIMTIHQKLKDKKLRG